MFKRLRWLAVGYVFGLATSYFVALRVRRVVHRFTPPEVRGRVGDQMVAWRHDVRAAWVEGRAAMSARERELRSERHVVADVADVADRAEAV